MLMDTVSWKSIVNNWENALKSAQKKGCGGVNAPTTPFFFANT